MRVNNSSAKRKVDEIAADLPQFELNMNEGTTQQNLCKDILRLFLR